MSTIVETPEDKIKNGLHLLLEEKEAAIAEQEAALADLQHMLEDPKHIEFLVVVNSLWANEGEVSAEARSKDLKRAINTAGKRHQRKNSRSDFQVRWLIYAKIKSKRSQRLFRLPTFVYKDLLPGGSP